MKVKKEVRTMRKQKFYLYLNDTEQRIVLQSLVRLKNRLIQEGRYTDIVDEVIVKLMEATKKKTPWWAKPTGSLISTETLR